MIYEIKSNNTSVKVDTKGAQMTSFNVDGTELLWQGNPEFWGGQSPILFPIIGALRDGKALINGKWCSIPKHGYARQNEFKMTNQTENTLEFELTPNDEIKEGYPIEFLLKAVFEVCENSYKTTYIVKNNDIVDMPFCVGAHPAFNIPFEENAKFEDYIFKFAEKETLSSPFFITGINMVDYTKPKMQLNEVDTVPFDNEMFENDAVIYENFKKSQVAIKNPKTGKSIQMNFDDFPMFAIWKPYNKAPFVCLEPWVGCNTTTEEDDEFTSKHNSKLLKPNEEMSFSFTVKYSD